MLTDIILIATGVVVGAMNSIAGGGTLLIFPVLMSLGVPAIVVNATSYVAVLPGRLSASLGYWHFLKKLPKQYLLLLIPALIGAITGSIWLSNTSSQDFDRLLPVLIFMAIGLFAIQPWLKHHILYNADRRRNYNYFNLASLSIMLFFIALYGGIFGAGLGFALLAILGFNKKYKMHYLNGIKNVIGALVCLVAIVVLADHNLINWHYGILLAIGNIVGGYIGARFSLKVPSHNIRWLVIITGLLVAVYLVLEYL